MWFFDNVCNNILTFFLDRVAKHGIICFADISSSSNTLKIWSKIPYVVFMGSFSNSALSNEVESKAWAQKALLH